MTIVAWNTPINAPWSRALVLRALKSGAGPLILNVEDEDRSCWQIAFRSVQAFRSTTEECAGSLYAQLPAPGGLFEMLESPWIGELGSAHLLAQAHHYIVCCYDELIEVIAWEADVSPLET